MRRLLTITGLVFCLTAITASAAAPKHVKPLRLVLTAGQTARMCTARIPASWTVAVWVSANGSDLKSASTSNVEYYTGSGTMVRVHLYTGRAPICIQAITWNRRTDVYIRFRVITTGND